LPKLYDVAVRAERAIDDRANCHNLWVEVRLSNSSIAVFVGVIAVAQVRCDALVVTR